MTRKLTFLLLIGAATLAQADPKEIKFKSRDLEKVKAEINQKKEESQRLQKEAEQLSQEVHDSEGKIRNVETSLLYTKQRNWEVEQQLATTKNQHDKLLTSAVQQRTALRTSFQKYYVASVLLSPDADIPVFSRQVLHGQAAQLKSTLNKSEETHQNLRTLVDTEQVIRNEVHKQEQKLSTIRAGAEDKARLLTKKKSRQETLEAEVHDLQVTAEQLASLIDVLRTKAKEEAETEKEARRIKQLSGQSPIPIHSLPWPMAGKVTTRFGRQQHPTLGTMYMSNGLVITSENPQDVTVVADGKVLYAGEFMSYGPMAVIEHPGDWYTVYGHLVHWNFEKGQEVKKGEKVGDARPLPGGGYESYFELRFYGKSTDPMPWLASTH